VNDATVVNVDVVGQHPALQMHVDQSLCINLPGDIGSTMISAHAMGSHWLRMTGLMGHREKLRERHGRTA
jgi:hypothetical protein